MGYQVLIVEDNEPAIRMMVDMLLTMQITNVTKSSNGESALKKVQFQKFDLIICDMNMPIMGGLDFFHIAKKSELIGSTPFLMVSAENEKNKITKALDLGINDYIVKPFSVEMFSSRVKKVLKISTEIHWSEDLALGNETLDDDHKYLITLVNAIVLAMNCDISLDNLLIHLSLLETHCKNHFRREEDLMVKIGSAELALHRSHHQNMLNQLRGLYEDIKSKISMEECRETLPCVEMLSSWIIRDVVDQDKKIKEYFIKAKSVQLKSKPPEIWGTSGLTE